MRNYKKIGIIGAMDVETEKFCTHIENLTTKEYANKIFMMGNIGKYEVVVTTSGIGKVSAACTAQIMIDIFGAECIINTGIAGSLSEEVHTCDVVISSDTVYHDLLTDEPEISPIPANEELVKKVYDICKKSDVLKGHSAFIGRIATGDQFVTEHKEKERIINFCEGPLCVEMEGGAIAQCAYLNNVDFIIIRAISDSADENSTVTYYELKEFTANLSASIVIELLNS